jgi:hypothetical protein
MPLGRRYLRDRCSSGPSGIHSDVNSAIAISAMRMHMSTDQFFTLITKTGATELVRRALGE